MWCLETNIAINTKAHELAEKGQNPRNAMSALGISVPTREDAFLRVYEDVPVVKFKGKIQEAV